MGIKVFFLNPPFKGKFSREQRSPAVTKSGTIYYPMWLASSAGFVEEQGFEIDLVDAPAEGLSLDEVIARAISFAPAVAVVATSTPSIYSDVESTARLVEVIPGLKTILVGTHVSVMDRESLSLDGSITAVARREYEETVLEFCRAIEGNGDLTGIAGLTWRNRDEIVKNPDRPFLEDLDRIPFVSKTYKKFLDFRNYFSSIARYPQVTIITGRGCPYGCRYCVYPQTQMGRGYRFRNVDRVLDEIDFILGNFPGIQEIFFEDDTLTADKDRCRDFCAKILQRNLRFSWTANSRADVDARTLQAMKAAGCRLVCVGVESGSQEILDGIGKAITLPQIETFFNSAREAGILVHGCFMVGNPGETRATMEQTFQFARRLNPDTAQFFPIMVYPGTKTYQWAEQNHYLETTDFARWLTDDGLHNCVVSTESLTSVELVGFCNSARRRFYFRPSYILSKAAQMILSREERRRTWKSAMTFKNYVFRK
jgi:anaerobic magnesium-protoporphyrin IX monomethyl ester cyclase